MHAMLARMHAMHAMLHRMHAMHAMSMAASMWHACTHARMHANAMWHACTPCMPRTRARAQVPMLGAPQLYYSGRHVLNEVSAQVEIFQALSSTLRSRCVCVRVFVFACGKGG